MIEAGIPKSYVQNFYPAVDRRNTEIKSMLSQEKLKDFESIYKRPPKCGEIGCLESHLGVYKTFLESNNDVCLILEDDNIVPNGLLFQDAIQTLEIAKSISNRIDSFVINIGLTENQITSAIKQEITSKKFNSPIKLYRCLHSESGIWRANAYILNRKAAENILNHTMGSTLLADDWSKRRSLGMITEIIIPEKPILHQNEELETTVQIDNKTEEAARNTGQPKFNKQKININESLKYRSKIIYYKILSKFFFII